MKRTGMEGATLRERVLVNLIIVVVLILGPLYKALLWIRYHRKRLLRFAANGNQLRIDL